MLSAISHAKSSFRPLAVLARAYAAPAKAKKGGKNVNKVSKYEYLKGDFYTDRYNGLNYFIAGEDPKIKPDSEYPDWLWTILDKDEDLLSKRNLRAEAAARIRAQNKIAAST